MFLNGKGLSLYVSVFVSLLLSVSWVMFGTERTDGDRIPFFAAVIAIAFLLSFVTLQRINIVRNFPSAVDTKGIVMSVRPWGKAHAMLLDTEYGKFAAYQFGPVPAEGTLLSLRGVLFDFKRASDGSFDEYLFWRSNGASKKIVIMSMREIGVPEGIYKWRNSLTERIQSELPPNVAGYMLALTVGARDDFLTKLHRSAGTVHLLSVSGFHVGILAAMLTFFMRRGRRRIIALSLVMWAYLALAGLPPGGIRAALMVQIHLLGLLFGKPSSPFNSVCVAGVILLMINPMMFYNAGWRLSMSAAMFITAFARMCGRSFLSALAASALVWFVTAPLIASIFKEVPIAGLVMNVFAIPLFAFIFPAVIAVSLPALMGVPFGYSIASAMEYLLEAWNIFSSGVTAVLPWSVVSTTPLLMTSLCISWGAFAYASGVGKKRIPLITVAYVFCSLFLVKML